MRITRWAGTMFLVAGTACRAAPRDLAEDETRAIADSIRTVARVFAEGTNAIDVDRFAGYFEHPALTWAADGQLMLVGPDSLLAFYRAVYRGFRQMQFGWDTLHVGVPDRHTAFLTGAGHYTVTDTAGQTTNHAVAVTYLFTRERGRWELLHGHASHRALP